MVKLCLLLLLAVTCLGSVRPTFSQSVKPLGLEVSLARDEIVLGEPVVLRYRITNSNSGAAAFFLGDDGKGWLSLFLEDTALKQTVSGLGPSVPRATGQTRFGGHRGDYVPPQGTYEGISVRSRWLTVPRAGRYRIAVRARLPFAAASGTDAAVSLSDAEKSVLAIEKDISLTLVVKEANSAQLQITATALRNAAIQNGGGLTQQTAMEQLFAMRGPEALANWKRLANDPKLDIDGRRVLVLQLETLAERDLRQTVEFLGWMVWSSQQQVRWADAKSLLIDIYRTSSDKAMKRRIEQLFQNSEGVHPNTAPVISYDS